MDTKSFGKKPPAKSYYLLGKCARFISLRLIPTLAATSIGPNHLSFLSFIFSIMASILYSIGLPLYNQMAVIFFLLFFIADHLDGDLARYQGEESTAGEIMDHVIGKVALVLIYLGVCIGLIRLYDPSTIWFWGFILMAGFFGSQSLHFKRVIITSKKKIDDTVFKRETQFSKEDSLWRIIFKELTSTYMVAFYLLIIGSIFDKLYLSLILSAIHVWIYYVTQIYTSLKYFKNVDQKVS